MSPRSCSDKKEIHETCSCHFLSLSLSLSLPLSLSLSLSLTAGNIVYYSPIVFFTKLFCHWPKKVFQQQQWQQQQQQVQQPFRLSHETQLSDHFFNCVLMILFSSEKLFSARALSDKLAFSGFKWIEVNERSVKLEMGEIWAPAFDRNCPFEQKFGFGRMKVPKVVSTLNGRCSAVLAKVQLCEMVRAMGQTWRGKFVATWRKTDDYRSIQLAGARNIRVYYLDQLLGPILQTTLDYY